MLFTTALCTTEPGPNARKCKHFYLKSLLLTNVVESSVHFISIWSNNNNNNAK